MGHLQHMPGVSPATQRFAEHVFMLLIQNQILGICRICISACQLYLGFYNLF